MGLDYGIRTEKYTSLQLSDSAKFSNRRRDFDANTRASEVEVSLAT